MYSCGLQLFVNDYLLPAAQLWGSISILIQPNADLNNQIQHLNISGAGDGENDV